VYTPPNKQQSPLELSADNIGDEGTVGPVGAVSNVGAEVASTPTQRGESLLPTGAPERHFAGRSQWIRAGVLGANDGLISTASLIAGVAAANATRSTILIAGVAGLTAGAFSMAAGEYVSVSSQRDSELADLEMERGELKQHPKRELEELTQIYRARGLDADLARTVAVQLTKVDALHTHARDELGINPHQLANPWQAAIVSALSFTLGAGLPVLVIVATSTKARTFALLAVTLVGLMALGSLSARLGGAPRGKAVIRVVVGGALALAASLLIGNFAGRIG
jgi:vacuolar iron transporter family protein